MSEGGIAATVDKCMEWSKDRIKLKGGEGLGSGWTGVHGIHKGGGKLLRSGLRIIRRGGIRTHKLITSIV